MCRRESRMKDKKLFSQYYSTDNSTYKDKPRFRLRLLKYLEDFVNTNDSQLISRKCRSKMGLDIKKTQISSRQAHRLEFHYAVEQLFIDKPITDILDFAGVCYYALAPHQAQNPYLVSTLLTYKEEVNSIFREESMCYELNDAGDIRYYPDEEFQKLIQCSLLNLNKPKYNDNLTAFNETLDDFYKNHGTESPIIKLFKTIETFVLSILNDQKYNRLCNQTTEKIIELANNKSKQDSTFTDNDREAIFEFKDTFNGWIKMCHKYRHGKPNQQNIPLPPSLFNLIFSVGISILRFLLELDDKYQLYKTSVDN